jgi:KUP system potassium uptake protein
LPLVDKEPIVGSMLVQARLPSPVADWSIMKFSNEAGAVGSAIAAASTPAAAGHPARGALMVGALGVVFGDIGTSPIYAFRESIKAAGGDRAMETTVFGVLSLVFWAIVIIVAIKYVLVVMRADNEGEGGTMALLSLALPAAGPLRNALLIVGLGGASLFFGDAMITPAISVLSAVEGAEVAAPLLKPDVVPLAAVVLIGLFLIQSHGSGRVGRFFGPIMALWFALLALSGLWNIKAHPDVLSALNPQYAFGFLTHANGWIAFTSSLH